MDTGYERVLLSKQEVFLYQVPPRTTARAYKASDWNLAAPNWTVRMRMVTKGGGLIFVRLEDKISGQLFAQCPIDSFPSASVESVSDSSRYFVIRVVNDQTGKQAFLGLGFGDRADSFDFNVALQDFFKEKHTEEQIQKEALKEDQQQKPKLDLGFKEGQTITISIGGKGGEGGGGTTRSRPRAAAGAAGTTPLLPPPPSAGGTRRARSPATAAKSVTQPNVSQSPENETNAPAVSTSAHGSFDDSKDADASSMGLVVNDAGGRGEPIAASSRQQQQQSVTAAAPASNQDILSLFG